MEEIRKRRAGRTSTFEEAFKRKAVLESHHSRDTLKAVAGRYGVSRTTLSSWIAEYEQERQRLLSLGTMEADKSGSGGDDAPVNDEVEGSVKHVAPEELKVLQEELRLARIKLACLETLIDLTEKDLGIDIRKKAGTRSSAE